MFYGDLIVRTTENIPGSGLITSKAMADMLKTGVMSPAMSN